MNLQLLSVCFLGGAFVQTLLRNLFQDLQYAYRQLWKSPGFTITAVLSLSIGIGVNTASFSIMDAIVLRPVAVPDLNQVVALYEQRDHGDAQWITLGDFADWQRQSRSFEDMAVRSPSDMSLTGAGDAVHVQAEYTTPNFFSILRTGAALGRTFNADETEPGGNGVAVLSYGFWKSHFGSDGKVVGRKVELDLHTYTIIGVMPKAMQYPSTAEVFLPFAPAAADLANHTSHNYLAIGRLKKGASVRDAQADLNVISEHLAQAYPDTNRGWQAKVEPLLDDINSAETPLYSDLVQGATLFVLLVVCANIANLQFARGIARRPEIAMRTALGAGRARLLSQLLTENIWLGLLGGAGGLLFAAGYMHISKVSMPERVARYLAGWSNISLNGRALAFSLVLAILAGIVSGFAPALEALRINLVDQLKSGSRSIAGSGRSRKLRNVLAISQVSLAVALVIGATLMCKGMLGMLHLADAYQPKKMLTFDVQLPKARYDTPQKIAAWYSQSLERLRAMPAVEHAEVTQALPDSDYAWLDDCQIENLPTTPGNSSRALRIPISAGYLGALHVGLVAGRNFTASDNLQSQPVAIVSRGFVARYFPGTNPLGHRVRFASDPKNSTPWMTIVGVSDEVSYSMWDRSRPAAIYMSESQLPRPDMTYSIIVHGDPLSFAGAAHKALAELDPSLPLDGVQTYSGFIHEKLVGLFYVAAMLGLDAVVALLLAAIGIFGVMANLVGERTREIGVRLALGAQRTDVLRMVLRRAGWLTGIGVCAGLLLAFALAHGVASLLLEVSPNDPVVFASITAIITTVALIASWLPARRAARIDPMAALRDE
jgi:putative ABC transport system permease protein